MPKPEPKTAVRYFYRDAHNYKSESETVILAGEITFDELKKKCRCRYYDGFIPDDVGLRELQDTMASKPNDEVDHPWHEWSNAEPYEGSTAPEMTVEEFLARFAQVTWNQEAAMGRMGIGDDS